MTISFLSQIAKWHAEHAKSQRNSAAALGALDQGKHSAAAAHITREAEFHERAASEIDGHVSDIKSAAAALESFNPLFDLAIEIQTSARAEKVLNAAKS